MEAEATYKFTNNWFDEHKEVWSQLLKQINPTKILEVGSYEGKSTVFMIEALAATNAIEIHCIDSWEGGIEHKAGGYVEANMSSIEASFQHNIKVAKNKCNHLVKLNIHKGLSNKELPKLLANGMQGYYDFIYIDGSHQAPDVLLDAILGFELLRVGGVIAFDDYLWQEPLSTGTDPIRCPKTSIDAFTNIYCRKLSVIRAPLYQLFIRKSSN